MDKRPQGFANHRAIPPPVYTVGVVIYLAAIGIQAWALWQQPSLQGAALLAVMLGLLSTHYWARRSAQIVQDRLILLEMRLRLERLMPGRESWRALGRAQLIALRFASDAELPGLVERSLKGGLARPDDIKRAIVDWQTDWHRV